MKSILSVICILAIGNSELQAHQPVVTERCYEQGLLLYDPCDGYAGGSPCGQTEFECDQYVLRKLHVDPECGMGGLPTIEPTNGIGNELTFERVVCIQYGECTWDPLMSICTAEAPWYENGPDVPVLGLTCDPEGVSDVGHGSPPLPINAPNP